MPSTTFRLENNLKKPFLAVLSDRIGDALVLPMIIVQPMDAVVANEYSVATIFLIIVNVNKTIFPRVSYIIMGLKRFPTAHY